MTSKTGPGSVIACNLFKYTRILSSPPLSPAQVLYYNSGRKLLIPTAVLAFLTLSTGTWLFTIVHPAFYWFGVPSVFLIIYLGCHCEQSSAAKGWGSVPLRYARARYAELSAYK